MNTEKLITPKGETVWVASDDEVPGPYGVGSTEEEASGDLRKALAFWGKTPVFRVVDERSWSRDEGYWWSRQQGSEEGS